MLRRILVTDDPGLSTIETDVVVWLGRGSAPRQVSRHGLVVQPSSLRSAALYLATERAAEVKLALRDPMSFVLELLRVRAEPALRAA